MNLYPQLFFLILFSILINESSAQKTALGKPKSFERPVLRYDDEDKSTPYPIESKENAPWIVICDQKGVKTYERVNSSDRLETPKKGLEFREWFYVSDETPNHIRIFKGTINPTTFRMSKDAQDYGWVNKKDMLLWTSSLTDEVTKIDLKAFLLNKASDVEEIFKSKKKEIVKIYSGPHTTETLEDKHIYEFYFVFKKEGNRYLLSKNVNINPSHHADDLIGWVEQGRLELWNTRICMEPNFEEEAFKERKLNPNFHLIAYGDPGSAISHSETGKRIDSKAIWSNDPATLAPSSLASDERRFEGGVIRFPMLSEVRRSAYFRTGLIGKLLLKDKTSIPEPDWASITKLIEKREMGLHRNFDVLFVIEGTKSMANYKTAIAEAIKKVSQQFVNVPNVRYGVAVFRDTPEKPDNKLFDIRPMHSNVNKSVKFVSKIEFARWHDNDNYSALYYGINQAIIESNMNDQHTNIVFVMGNNADLKSERSRKEVDECYIKTDELASKLANLNAHIVAIQCKNQNREGDYFAKNIRTVMLETANMQYNTYNQISSTLPDITVKAPELTDDNQLKNGANIGMILSPPKNSSMTEQEIIDKAETAAKKIYEYVDVFWKDINKLVGNGTSLKNIDPENFSSPAANILFNVVDKSKKRGITQENLEKITKEKYQLYTEVYIPKRIKGAEYDTYSQVVFMPERDLEHYVEMLESLSAALMRPADEIRQALHDSLADLVKQYTGHKSVPRDFKINELRAVMQGISLEGLKVNKRRDFAIENVLNEKKMPIKKVIEFSNAIVEKGKKLREINTQGKSYEFSYSSEDNTYFWIPIEYTF